jgi:hypothetical protein
MKIQEEKKVVRLKKPILACAVLLGAAMSLQATPVCPTTGTYVTLQTTGVTASTPFGSCTIGDKTFSNFTYSDSAVGAVPVTPSNLTYTVIDSGPSAIGFLFGVALTAPAGGVNDLGVGYTVTGPDITDAAVTMAGLAVPSGSGATASIAETICPGHVVAGCLSSLQLSTYDIAGVAKKGSDMVTFSPVGTLGVLKDVDVVGGSGFASISLFSDTVSQGGSVPEPGFYGVLAGGIGAIVMFARRRKKTA